MEKGPKRSDYGFKSEWRDAQAEFTAKEFEKENGKKDEFNRWDTMQELHESGIDTSRPDGKILSNSELATIEANKDLILNSQAEYNRTKSDAKSAENIAKMRPEYEAAKKEAFDNFENKQKQKTFDVKYDFNFNSPKNDLENNNEIIPTRGVVDSEELKKILLHNNKIVEQNRNRSQEEIKNDIEDKEAQETKIQKLSKTGAANIGIFARMKGFPSSVWNKLTGGRNEDSYIKVSSWVKKGATLGAMSAMLFGQSVSTFASEVNDTTDQDRVEDFQEKSGDVSFDDALNAAINNEASAVQDFDESQTDSEVRSENMITSETATMKTAGSQVDSDSAAGIAEEATASQSSTEVLENQGTKETVRTEENAEAQKETDLNNEKQKETDEEYDDIDEGDKSKATIVEQTEDGVAGWNKNKEEETPPKEEETTPPKEEETTPPKEEETTPPKEEETTPPKEEIVYNPRTKTLTVEEASQEKSKNTLPQTGEVAQSGMQIAGGGIVGGIGGGYLAKLLNRRKRRKNEKR